MDVRRNRRFDVGQRVDLLFNPKQKLTNGKLDAYVNNQTDESFLTYSNYNEDYLTVNIDNNDVIASVYFGGRVYNQYYSNINIGVPYDAFGSSSSHYLEGYAESDMYVFGQRSSGYWYCKNGSGYVAESGDTASDNNRIEGVRISNVKLKADNKTFGYGEQTFQNNWEDIVTVQIPANISEWKLQQLVNSTATAIKGNSDLYNVIPDESEYEDAYDVEYGTDVTTTSEWTDITNYNYYKQFGGGSCSPVVRMINIDKPSIKYNKRKNTISVDLVLLG